MKQTNGVGKLGEGMRQGICEVFVFFLTMGVIAGTACGMHPNIDLSHLFLIGNINQFLVAELSGLVVAIGMTIFFAVVASLHMGERREENLSMGRVMMFFFLLIGVFGVLVRLTALAEDQGGIAVFLECVLSGLFFGTVFILAIGLIFSITTVLDLC